jgi:molecular chaperone HtpG
MARLLYTIAPDTRPFRGTDIILHISDDCTEYLDNTRIQALLDKYCKFLPVEIQFGTRTERTYEGEGDNEKEIATEVANVINNTTPLWKKTPTELSDDDYRNFYNELFPYSTPPLFWIHLNIDYPFNLTGVLYFPKLTNNVENQRNKISLYSNQVYVTDEVKEIVPEFLTLLHGVIDSPDIPLNVSRSYLQSDKNVKQITNYITKKVADRLAELFKNDRPQFEEKWENIGVFVKYGILADEKFAERALKFALLNTLDNKAYTLDEYKELVAPTQTDKNNKLVCLYTNAPNEHHHYIQLAQQAGYSVLRMDGMLDPHFMQKLEQAPNANLTFVRVDSNTLDKLIEKDTQRESILTSDEQQQIENLFKPILPTTEAHLQMQALSPEEPPVTIVKPEFLRRWREMSLLNGMDMSMMPDSYTVVVNTNHPIVAQKILTAPQPAHLAKHLYHLALLQQGMLKGAQLTEFVQHTISTL